MTQAVMTGASVGSLIGALVSASILADPPTTPWLRPILLFAGIASVWLTVVNYLYYRWARRLIEASDELESEAIERRATYMIPRIDRARSAARVVARRSIMACILTAVCTLIEIVTLVKTF